jgi:small-conductance mechanosensitive channel
MLRERNTGTCRGIIGVKAGACRNVPAGRLKEDFTPMTDQLIALGELLAALAVAWGLHALVYRTATRLTANRDLFWRSLVARTQQPTLLAFLIIALSLTASLAPLTDREIAILRRALLIAFVVCAAWLARTALHIWVTLHLRRFELDTEDNLLARKHITQSRMLQRIADTLIIVLGIAAVLMTFPGVRQYGVSLLAAGGAAGIVVGLALQPLLKNLIAGFQLAITQPIRIDDAVIVEGEWGNVEEITSTYVVIRIWDRRRLVVPLNYFMEKPFQNWTRQEAALIGAVFIYLDYSVPIDAIRTKLDEILRQSKHWNGDVGVVQVTDFRETVMEVRILASASNAGRAFDLRCEIREKLAKFLQENYPQSLPRMRGEVAMSDGPDRQRHRAERKPAAKGASIQ